MNRARQGWAAVLAALLCAAFAGCGTVGFYRQAIRGQREILEKARPVADVMKDARVAADTKRKLAVTQDARAFALARLGLPAGRLYDRFTDIGRRQVSWVVCAAPEFSTEEKTWWYPLLGRLEYRGYFAKADAQAEAARLRARGYDVHVGGVEAYSTLGWFRDPVLNTFLHRGDAELAELVFHELTHVQLFLPGDTEFNEAFATAVAEEGVRRWLKAKGDARGLARYEAGLRRDRGVVRLLLGVREELKRLYSDKSQTPEQMRRGKAQILARLDGGLDQFRGGQRDASRHDRKRSVPWNNARLGTVAAYYELVPGFERLLRMHGGDLRAFFAAVEKMRWMSKDERRAALWSASGAN